MSGEPAGSAGPKPKKSVALSGVPAGNTALCTVGRQGNDLHYRGYDILDFAEKAEFEEVAYLLVHGKLPTLPELSAYKQKLRAMRGLPAVVQDILECIPANTHPMDVLRTGCSVLGSVLPESQEHKVAEARDVADRLIASFGSMLLYWYHYSHSGRRIDVETDDDSVGGHFLHLLHGKRPSELWVRAMHTSLILYAEHEFNASTFTARVIAGTGADMYSALTGAIGALKGPKHGGANEFAFDVIGRYDTPDDAEADIVRRVAEKQIIIGFGHPVYTIADPRNQVIKEVAKRLSQDAGDMKLFGISERARASHVAREEDVSQPRLVQRHELPHDGRADADVHAHFRDQPHHRLVRSCDRATHRRQDHPPQRELHGTRGSDLGPDRETQIVLAPCARFGEAYSIDHSGS